MADLGRQMVLTIGRIDGIMIIWISILLNILLFAGVVRLLTRQHRQAAVAERKASVEENTPSGKNRILVVGMDEYTETDLIACLQGDYDLLFVKNGQQAVSLMENMQVDLVVSEYLMQEMSGDELCHAIRLNTATCRVPVVFLSSSSHSADIVYGLEAGARDYITKPYDITILKARIAMVLSESRKDNAEDGLEKEVKDPYDLAFLQRLDKVIRGQLANSDLQINDICREMGMSRTAIFTKVKAVTGHSPNDYLRIFRLNESKRLLEAKLWTIAEVAVKVGFNDSKYFSTCFKKQFGISPRKLLNNQHKL